MKLKTGDYAMFKSPNNSYENYAMFNNDDLNWARPGDLGIVLMIGHKWTMVMFKSVISYEYTKNISKCFKKL